MNKILNITNKLEDKKRKQQKKIHRGKMETLQRIVQCSSCHFKCAMCGYHLSTADSPNAPSSSPSNFYLCESCRDEFREYMKMTSGKKESDIFWHNREWMKLWSAWFDFQQAIKEFKNSVEFEQLIEELDN
jgi:hypothetical protein